VAEAVVSGDIPDLPTTIRNELRGADPSTVASLEFGSLVVVSPKRHGHPAHTR